MGKAEENKRKKREALLSAAYNLFLEKGFHATSISEIVANAGVAKGTFYLYFRDKYDIKAKVVQHKVYGLFDQAESALSECEIVGFDNQLIFLIDHIIDALVADDQLLEFIAGNLISGSLRTMIYDGEEAQNITFEIYERFMSLLDNDKHDYDNIHIMVFTIVELAVSAAYNGIRYSQPVPLKEYKPYLYRTIRYIIQSHIKE